MFGFNRVPDWMGAIERMKANITEDEVNECYQNMKEKWGGMLPQLGGPDITYEQWRDDRIAEIRERELSSNKSGVDNG